MVRPAFSFHLLRMVLDPTLVEAMRGLAVPPVVIGEGRADTWFDGFWDFFIRERTRLASEPSIWVSGKPRRARET